MFQSAPGGKWAAPASRPAPSVGVWRACWGHPSCAAPAGWSVGQTRAPNPAAAVLVLDRLCSFLKLPSSKCCRMLLPRPFTMNFTQSFLWVSLLLFSGKSILFTTPSQQISSASVVRFLDQWSSTTITSLITSRFWNHKGHQNYVFTELGLVAGNWCEHVCSVAIAGCCGEITCLLSLIILCIIITWLKPDWPDHIFQSSNAHIRLGPTSIHWIAVNIPLHCFTIYIAPSHWPSTGITRKA